MTLLDVVVVLILVGIGLWLINTKLTTMDPTIKSILNIVVIVVIVVWLLRIFGVLSHLNPRITP